MKVKIKLVTADDWEGLFINDQLYTEDHSLNAWDVVMSLRDKLNNKDINISFQTYRIDQDYMEEICELPTLFKDIDQSQLEITDVY